MKRIDWNQLDDPAREAVLRRPVQAVSDAVRSGVQAVFDEVATRGDAALRDFTARFDGVALEAFEVDADEFARAADAVPAEVQAMQAIAALQEELNRQTAAGASEAALRALRQRVAESRQALALRLEHLRLSGSL